MIIGQEHILRELNYILPEIKRGKNENLLFRSPSGYGKTTLGLDCCVRVNALESEYVLPRDGNVILNFKFRIHFIDECHEIRVPEELYPLMDSKKYSFIFATNEVAELKEPLVNRCIQFFFKEYTREELLQIAKLHLRLNDDLLYEIINNCNRNPRILIKLCERVERVIHAGIKIDTTEKMKGVINEVFDVVDGLNEIHLRYLDFLRTVNSASLDMISSAIHIDKETIKHEIEPILLYRRNIQITSRGRKINA